MKCSMCGSKLDIRLHLNHALNTFTIETIESEDLNQILIAALLQYWRWKAEGGRPYWKTFRLANMREPVQYYYDPSHAAITYNPAKNRYSFAILLSESPHGDTWAFGTFQYDRGEIVDLILDKEPGMKEGRE